MRFFRKPQGSCEVDLRKEFDEIVYGINGCKPHNTLILIRNMRLRDGNRIQCECYNTLTNEANSETECKYCLGEGYIWDEILKRCVPDIIECPPGTVYNPITKKCDMIIQDCPEGYFFNETTGLCEQIECPAGTVYDNVSNSCIPISKTCPDGTFYNEKTDTCDKIKQECPDGYILDENGKCVIDKTCPDGQLYNEQTKQCEQYECPAGTSFNVQTGLCEKINCPQGFALNQNNECEKICPDGGVWDKFLKQCVFNNGVSKSAFQFAYRDTVPLPIICDVEGAEAGGGYDARAPYYEVAPQMTLSIKITWQVFVSQNDLHDLRESILNPENNTPVFRIPDGGVAVSNSAGVYNETVTAANTKGRIGAAILSPYPTNRQFFDGNVTQTVSTYIIFKIEYETNGKDYDYYQYWNSGGPSFDPCKQRIEEIMHDQGLRSDYDDTGYWDRLGSEPSLPIDHFDPAPEVHIMPMIDKLEFLELQEKYPNDIVNQSQHVITIS